MNRGRLNGGYTVVETMIFLAVSAVLFVSAMALVGGRQQRAQFTQSARDFEVALQDIANDVSTGYYANSIPGTSQYINCNASLTITAGSNNQGANKNCILIGRALQINPRGSGQEQINLYSLAGRRTTATGADVSSIAESSVKAIARASPGDTSTPDVIEAKRFPGIEFSCMLYATAPVTFDDRPCASLPSGVTKSDTLVFITTFVATDVAGNRQAGDSYVNLYTHPLTGPGYGERTSMAVASDLNRYTSISPAPAGRIKPEENPAGGVYICLQNGASNQFALLQIGGQGSRFATDLSIRSGRCL